MHPTSGNNHSRTEGGINFVPLTSGEVDEKCAGLIVWTVAFLLHILTEFIANFGYKLSGLVTSDSLIMVWTIAVGYILGAVIMVCLRPMLECGTKVTSFTKIILTLFVQKPVVLFFQSLTSMKIPLTLNQVCGGPQRVTVGPTHGSLNEDTSSSRSHRPNYPRSRCVILCLKPNNHWGQDSQTPVWEGTHLGNNRLGSNDFNQSDFGPSVAYFSNL